MAPAPRGSRPGRRPASHRSPGAARPARHRRVERPASSAVVAPRAGGARRGLTGRAAVLAVVLVALALTLAYPLRSYLGQRGEIAELRAQVAGQHERVAQLERARERWQDEAYVRTQARERLHYAMPGETQYVVLEPDEAPAARPAPAAEPGPRGPWYSELWRSVEGSARGAAAGQEGR